MYSNIDNDSLEMMIKTQEAKDLRECWKQTYICIFNDFC